MLIVMKAHASEEQVERVCEKIESLGFRAHAMPGAMRTAIGVTGNQTEVETGTFDEMEGVQEVIRVTKPYKLVSRDHKRRRHDHPLPQLRRHFWRRRGSGHRRPVRHRVPRAGVHYR